MKTRSVLFAAGLALVLIGAAALTIAQAWSSWRSCVISTASNDGKPRPSKRKICAAPHELRTWKVLRSSLPSPTTR